MPDGWVPWPPEFADRYRREGLWAGRPLGALLRDAARRCGSALALVEGERRIRYAELDARADRLAAGLHRRGLRAGDRVVVQLPNRAEFAEVCFALFRIGALPVFALPSHRRTELRHLCEVSEAVAVVVPDTFQGFDHRQLAAEVQTDVPAVRSVYVAGEPGAFTALSAVDEEPLTLPDPDPSEVALFLLSGGTTGLPKLIPRTHDDYAYNVRASSQNAELTEHDVYLAALPIAHNYALACPGILGVLSAGGTAVLAASGSPDEVFPLIEREGVTVSGLVPPLALLWADAAPLFDHDLSTLRLLQVGGSKLAPSGAKRVLGTLGCSLQQSFGMAEGLLSQTPPDASVERRVIAQGRPVSPADEVRIVDRNGQDVTEGGTGELLIRGPYTVRGYYRSAEYNQLAFTDEGFLRTGDLARRTADGDLVIEGRIKDVVNRGGDKVTTSEVEELLLGHPDVADVAVIGTPDPVMGERVCACVVPRVGTELRLTTLTAYLKGREVAAYKCPDSLVLLEDLPRTGVGKPDKAALRQQAGAR